VRSIRVAFAGDPQLALECAPAAPGIDTVDLAGPSPPDVVLALAPEPGAVEALADSPAPVLVWLTGGGSVHGLRPQDRVISTDRRPRGVWRTLPLPVGDARFAAATGTAAAGRALWLTEDGPRRREYLEHFEHSVALVEPPEDAAVAINLRDDGDHGRLTSRAAAALAAGRLLVSETLEPSFGLEPGLDYLEGRELDDIFVTVENAARTPEAFRRVRIRGRRKAEWFRASRVIRKLVEDLELELP
jgi:hypothetical protein